MVSKFLCLLVLLLLRSRTFTTIIKQYNNESTLIRTKLNTIYEITSHQIDICGTSRKCIAKEIAKTRAYQDHKIFDHTEISQWKCDVKKRKFWAINWTTTVKNTKNSLGTTMQAQIHETMKVFVAALFSQLALLLLLGFLFYTHTAYRHLHMKSICCFFLELLLHTDLNTDAWHFIWVLLCCVCDVRDFFLATFQPLGFYIPFRFFRLRWFCFRPRWCFLRHSSSSSCFFFVSPAFL